MKLVDISSKILYNICVNKERGEYKMNFCFQYDKTWKTTKIYLMSIPHGWKQNIFCVDRDFIRINVEASTLKDAENKVKEFINEQVENKRKTGKPMLNMWVDKIPREVCCSIGYDNKDDGYIRGIYNYTNNYMCIKVIPSEINEVELNRLINS